MKNGMAIGSLARQLKYSAERISDLTMDIEQFEQGNDGMVQTCQELLLDELEHAQMLVLKLTEFITQVVADNATPVNTDEGGSAFGPGELTDDVGEVEEPNADCVDSE